MLAQLSKRQAFKLKSHRKSTPNLAGDTHQDFNLSD
jgi:hypothetical protein